MLTPVVSKTKKAAKAKSGREVAKNLILRREVPGNVTEQLPPKTPEEVAPNAGAQQSFTESELVQLDLLFDMMSWLIYLLSGNYEMMNQLGGSIDFKSLEPAQAIAVKDKLRDKTAGIAEKIDKMISSPAPLEPSAVSDIQNEIKAAI